MMRKRKNQFPPQKFHLSLPGGGSAERPGSHQWVECLTILRENETPSKRRDIPVFEKEFHIIFRDNNKKKEEEEEKEIYEREKKIRYKKPETAERR